MLSAILMSVMVPKNKILSFLQKLFNFLIRTDTQTHDLPSIYGQVKFFMPFFDTFHFTTFASLTPFVKDKQSFLKYRNQPTSAKFVQSFVVILKKD
jgi:hypothetical protein